MGFTFNPAAEEPVNGKYNHWRGFNYPTVPSMALNEAMAGCNLYLDHISEAVCGGDEASYNWIINYLAHLVQFPAEKPETAIVIVGRKGAGKSLVFDVVGSLAKDNYVVTADRRMMLGNFNSHMETALVFQFEEAFWAGDKKSEGKLKLLITGKHHLIEHKGYDAYMVGNYARIFITSNEDWAVPATVDERRFAVFECQSDWIGDKEYFNAIYRQLERNGGMGYRALMTVLMKTKVDRTAVHVAPKTEALADQKLETLEPVAVWLHAALQEGLIVPSYRSSDDDTGDWPRDIRCSDVYDEYRAHVKDQGARYPISKRSLGKKLQAMLGDGVRRGRKNTKDFKGYYYRFERLKICRANFVKWFGHEIKW
jgi:hypothetical protein